MTLLHDHLARHACLRPDAEAVTDGTSRLRYRELAVEAERVARRLGGVGVGPGQRVLLCMTRSVWCIPAMLGTLQTGAACVPVDVRTPPARLRQILGRCGPAAVLCDAAHAAAMAEDESLARAGAAILVVDGGGEVAPPRAVPWDGSPDETACVLFTSGSTGQPKGVQLSHRNIDEYVRWAVDRIGITEGDRILGTAPFYFDMSLFDVYCGLRAGAALCIVPERTLLFPRLLLELAEREGATVWKGVSSLLMYLSRTGSLAPDRLPRMRAVLFAGEVLPARYLRDWMTTFPDKAFYNFYGPTEATGASTSYRVPRAPTADEAIPIGLPRDNTDLYLLDPERRPVAPGEIGEIALSGVCISRGYLGDPERTARVFADDPWRPGQRMYLTGDLGRRLEDGNYAFVGRKDDQVKVMGYRVELGDIEGALTAIDGVAEAGALLCEPGRAGVEELVAYVVLAGEKSAAEVQAELKQRLPPYMQPRQIVPTDRLPRGDRGKLDRHALAAHHRARSGER